MLLSLASNWIPSTREGHFIVIRQFPGKLPEALDEGSSRKVQAPLVVIV